jgi:hypothetical protein
MKRGNPAVTQPNPAAHKLKTSQKEMTKMKKHSHLAKSKLSGEGDDVEDSSEDTESPSRRTQIRKKKTRQRTISATSRTKPAFSVCLPLRTRSRHTRTSQLAIPSSPSAKQSSTCSSTLSQFRPSGRQGTRLTGFCVRGMEVGRSYVPRGGADTRIVQHLFFC